MKGSLGIGRAPEGPTWQVWKTEKRISTTSKYNSMTLETDAPSALLYNITSCDGQLVISDA